MEPPKGTSLRQNTLFELLTVKIGQPVWAVRCSLKTKKAEKKEKKTNFVEISGPHILGTLQMIQTIFGM
jgi:hypothetical protein